ncbi:hypothetical protein KMZ93_04305 [Bradyrhizobium sediminis]|uniref:Uncharacterized protein n=1 Tax=Bradyrhizobium sediminis TaxID=2840469 RepID=A0A975NZA1_9BRAD|nr:hypothetical protein [Bradyrhizobium sediminis]QWG24158.1 hypothetical protein KMZ93_04305 [Bradyrhizobium sediminis]
MAILDVLQRYDVLPSSYVKAQPFSTPDYIEKCITELGKAKLIKLADGYEHFMALYRVRPIQITELGERYLGGRFLGRTKANDHFKHRYLRSVLEYHRDRLPAEIEALETPTIDLRAKTLNPDGHWRITYRDVETATMYFHQEDDTGSERLTGHGGFESSKKTIRTMLKAYDEYYTDGHYKDQYPTISVLIHTTKEYRAANILDLIEQEASEQWKPRFAVKAVPDFLEEPLLLPGANDNILATDYIRIGKSGARETFNIMDTLKATEQRKRGGK